MSEHVVHLDPETLLPVGVSKPCPSTTTATLGFKGLSAVRVPCGNLAGHHGPHIFHVEWTDPQFFHIEEPPAVRRSVSTEHTPSGEESA